jgi:hypothetical protein
MRIPDADYVIRIVGNPELEQFDEHEVLPFDTRENFENICTLLESREVQYSAQQPLADDGGVRA